MTAGSSPFDPKSLRREIRFLVIVVLVSAAVLLAGSVLPRNLFVALFILAPAVIALLCGVPKFFYDGFTLVSVSLAGASRTWFQVLVSLLVPIAFAVLLATRVDAMPLGTLWHIFTWWLLIPFGVLGYVGWYGSTVLDRTHPFRGFLITATALFVLCFLWTMGMISSSGDFGDDGSGSFMLDPERAQRAKATGEFAYTYIIYVFVAYGALLAGLLWRGSKNE